jgi:hypothetical protein
MSNLYISTDKYYTTRELSRLFLDMKIECQIYGNMSIICEGEKSKHEYGFKIFFLKLDKNIFKEKVWPILAKELNLRCAHIEYLNTYKGCILNWPGVFTIDNCTLADSNEQCHSNM